MISSVSQPVGTNVKIYLDSLKGKKIKVKFGKGKTRKRNVSFKGKIHEIRRGCVILKGVFIYNSWCGKYKSHPKPGCNKFLLSDITRIIKIESVTI